MKLAGRSAVMRLSRVVATAAASLIVSVAAEPAAVADPGDGIVDRAVSFTVHNVNAAGVPCSTDGGTYQVRGHLTGPADALSAGTAPDVSLYLHGLELGEWFWRFDGVPGYDHTREMAGRGHVSVTIDRLGYGASDQPAGTQSCVGGDATVTHQIVQQLRSGQYAADGAAVAFDRVALLGHSLGGAVAQIEAYTFGDVDALGVLSYSDLALTPEQLAGAPIWGAACLTGGRPSPDGAPGYANLTPDEGAFRQDFLGGATPDVQEAAAPLRAVNPCGDLVSLTEATPIDPLRLGEITVPVLVVAGGQDRVFDVNRSQFQGKLFTGSPDVTTEIVPAATHGLTLDATVGDFRDRLSNWLDAHGF